PRRVARGPRLRGRPLRPREAPRGVAAGPDLAHSPIHARERVLSAPLSGRRCARAHGRDGEPPRALLRAYHGGHTRSHGPRRSGARAYRRDPRDPDHALLSPGLALLGARRPRRRLLRGARPPRRPLLPRDRRDPADARRPPPPCAALRSHPPAHLTPVRGLVG